MVKSCCAPECENRFKKGSGLSFYRFPANVERRNAWISSLRRKYLPKLEHAYVCGDHFITGKKNRSKNHPDYIPTVFKHISNAEKKEKSKRVARYKRACKIAKRYRNVQLKRKKKSVPISEMGVHGHGSDNSLDDQVQDNSNAKVDELEVLVSNLTLDNVTLRKENQKLKQNTSTMLTEHQFIDNPFLVKFYTGLPSYSILKAVLEICERNIGEGFMSKLSKFQEMLITLMRLRLNLKEQDLAFRFNISQAKVSTLFHNWIHVLAQKLKFLIQWPERDVLRKTMPTCFKETFQNCAIIIDCFEIFIERPSQLLPRAQTFSSYKHHNTVKVLIGITPQGTISFISEPWGGRTSDVYLTENCGILKNLLPGDAVLADRGFTIEDSVGMYFAELVMPAFTRGKSQLSPQSVETTRKIANVRVHVERVIGLLRNKYSYLQSILKIKSIMAVNNESLLKDILIVAAAMCNLCESVIPLD